MQAALLERRRACEQFVEKDTKSVNVRSSIDVKAAEFGLLGAHISKCSDRLMDSRVNRSLRQLLV